MKNRRLIGYLGATCLLFGPQIFSQQVRLGSDSFFHFNRFYDTAMQMKEQTWQYFISMYGFHESRRIVNGLYGPLIAYFQGGLLLLTGTWFRYQFSSNLLLAFLAFFQ